MTLPAVKAARGTTRSSAAKMLPFVLMRRDVARGTERCIGVGHIYDQYEEAKQPLERRKLHRTFRKVKAWLKVVCFWPVRVVTT